MSAFESRLATNEFRRELSEHWSQYVFAAGYTSEDFDRITAEETHELGGIICSRVSRLMHASPTPPTGTYGSAEILAYLNAMSVLEKAEPRAGIKFAPLGGRHVYTK